MKYSLSILIAFTLSIPASGQSNFNKRLHFGFPAAALTSVLATDSCHYTTGIIADSVPPFKTGNIFVKFDLNGEPVSIKTLRSPLKTYETWEGDLIATKDGNLADIGYTIDSTLKMLFLKYTTEGDTLFTKEFFSPYYPGSSFFVARELILSPSGGFYILGGIEYYINDSNSDFVIMELDSNANLLWQKTYGSPDVHDFPEAMILDDDGGLLVGVRKDNRNVTNKNFIERTNIIKTDSLGNIEWEFLTPESVLRDAARGMVRTPDGGLVVASGKGIEEPVNQSVSFLSWESGIIFKLNTQLQYKWMVEIKDGIDPTYLNNFSKLIYSNDSSFVAAGQFLEIKSDTSRDIFGWLVKVSNNGELKWIRKHHIVKGNLDWHTVYDLKQTADGGFIMVGEARDFEADTLAQQAWIIKLDSFGCLVPGCQIVDATEKVQEEGTLLLYPNPARDYLNFFYRPAPGQSSRELSFRIFDASGRELQRFEAQSGEATYIVPLWHWSPGVYFLQLLHDGLPVRTERFVVER